MTNITYRHSDLPADARVSDPMTAIRVTVAAIVLALIAAYLLGAVIEAVPFSGQLPHDLVPLDDPALAAQFTA